MQLQIQIPILPIQKRKTRCFFKNHFHLKTIWRFQAMKKSKTSQLAHWLRKMKQMKPRARNDDGRSPSFHIFVIKAFEIIKTIRTFPFKKTLLNHQNFFICPAPKNFCFFAKNLVIRAKKTLKKPFLAHSAEKLPLLAILRKFKLFLKKPMYVLKKTQIFNVLKNLNLNGKCATNWWKGCKNVNANNWQTSGKIVRCEWMIFFFYGIKKLTK